MTDATTRRTRMMAAAAVPVLAAGALASGLGTAIAAAPVRSTGHVLAGSHPAWATQQVATPATATGTTFDLRIYLAPKGGLANLQQAVKAASTPGSASYHHFLSPAQYRAQFAPTSATVAAVRTWLAGAGLSVDGVDSANRFVSAHGSMSTLGKAFGVTYATYEFKATTALAPVNDAVIPDDIASEVLGITGLDSAPYTDTTNHVTDAAKVTLTKAQAAKGATPSGIPLPPGFRNARPCSTYYGGFQALAQADGTPLPMFKSMARGYAICGYRPSQLRTIYGTQGGSLDGTGVTVAIVDAYSSPTIRGDANTYAKRGGDAPFGATQYSQHLSAKGWRYATPCGASGWYGEETLDVEAVHSMAPGANVAYYPARSCFDSDLRDALMRIVDDNTASIVSNSWGGFSQYTTAPAVAAYEQIFMQGAMQGIGFSFSSGDYGDDLAATGTLQVEYPTSDPYVTSVGGTSTALYLSPTTGAPTVKFNTGWGTQKYSLAADGMSWTPIAPDPFVYGAGGGFSTLFNRPAYQTGIPVGSPQGRAIPDVAAVADPTTGMLIGETQVFPDGTYYGEYRIGGTSLASPLVAGIQALTQQNVGTRLGFANPALYAANAAGMVSDVTPLPYLGANVRVDYSNGLDPSAGLKYSVRTFDRDSSLHTGWGWDDVTGVGIIGPNYAMPSAKR